LVPTTNAIVGIDLADTTQMVGVTDCDSKVLVRKTFRCRVWDLGAALDWAAQRAAARSFAGVTVACEPTGHRWRVLGQLAADRGMPVVCVQPMVTSWSRRTEDLTFDKTDEKESSATKSPVPWNRPPGEFITMPGGLGEVSSALPAVR
jgi:transposase